MNFKTPSGGNSDPRTPAYKGDQLETIADYLKPAIVEALRTGTRSCLTCERFEEQNEVCNKYGGRPPARVIAFGCDGYEDKVPF